MMTTPFLTRCAVVLACVTALAGCGKPARNAVAAPASPTSVQQPVNPPATGDGIDRLDQMPLAKFLNGGLDAAAEDVAMVDLIEHCLRDAGYATLQLDRVRAATHTPERERRAQVGYGGAGVGDERSLPGQRWPEQIAAYASLRGESGAKFTATAEGCAGSARQVIDADKPMRDEALASRANQLVDEVSGAAEVQSATMRWADCMKARGLAVATPDDARRLALGVEGPSVVSRSPDSKAIAVADWACFEATLIGPIAAAQSRIVARLRQEFTRFG